MDNAKRRAKLNNLPFDLDVDDIVIPEVCPVLGIPLVSNWGGNKPQDSSPSLDRIVPALGYVRGNVVVVSFRVNRLKGDASIGELKDIAMFYENLIHSPAFLRVKRKEERATAAKTNRRRH